DQGSTVRAYVTATNTAGSATAISDHSAIVGPPPPPPTGPTTQLAWFYNLPSGDPAGPSVQTVEQRFTAAILSGHAVENGTIPTLLADGWTHPIFGYIESQYAMGPSTAPGNCPASYEGFTTSWTSHAGDFCTLVNPHEDWFLHDSSGARLHW